MHRETEAPLTVKQNKGNRTNCIHAAIGNIQLNTKCSLCRSRDKTLIHINNLFMKKKNERKRKLYRWEGSSAIGMNK